MPKHKAGYDCPNADTMLQDMVEFLVQPTCPKAQSHAANRRKMRCRLKVPCRGLSRGCENIDIA